MRCRVIEKMEETEERVKYFPMCHFNENGMKFVLKIQCRILLDSFRSKEGEK